jgi:hypothetical protein
MSAAGGLTSGLRATRNEKPELQHAMCYTEEPEHPESGCGFPIRRRIETERRPHPLTGYVRDTDSHYFLHPLFSFIFDTTHCLCYHVDMGTCRHVDTSTQLVYMSLCTKPHPSSFQVAYSFLFELLVLPPRPYTILILIAYYYK